jgi:gamma-glutamyltranspeptidase/glutathione hydrolase
MPESCGDRRKQVAQHVSPALSTFLLASGAGNMLRHRPVTALAPNGPWRRAPDYAPTMNGAIAAGQPLTAQAGADVLRRGGNAVDALIAAALTAFVTEGPLTGPTGGGFLLVHAGGETTMLDCFFAVPSATLGVMDEVVIDFADASTQNFHVGEGSVAVPGLLHGLAEIAERFASRPWAELVEPAIALAHRGFEPTAQQAFLYEILVPILQRTAAGRVIYGDPGSVNTSELVATLEAIRDRGERVAAELLPEFADDLARYRPQELEPLRMRFRGAEVLTVPSPSKGGAIVAEILRRVDAPEAAGLVALAAAIAAAYGAPAAPARITGTTHISVVDAAGNAAALSSTLGSGSGVFRGGSQLNNMLGELDVIGETVREPGERLPSMMTPTLVLADGRPRLVLGSAGSVRLAGAIAQVAYRVVGEGRTVADAIAASRVHVEGGIAHVEGGWPDAEIEALERDGGCDLVRWVDRNLFFGGVSAVEVSAGGKLAAAGDPRRGGHGVVVE